MNYILFNELAKWYDEVYIHKKYTEQQINFIDKLFKKHKVKNVLDVACGAGRHLIPLNKMGYNVDGIDYSKTFVKMLKNKLTKNEIKSSVNFGDMSKFKTKKKYDAIIVMFTSFNYMTTPKKQIDAFNCFNKALKKNGLLIIDTRNIWNNLALNDKNSIHTDTQSRKNLKLINTSKKEIDSRKLVFYFTQKYKAYENNKLKFSGKETQELGVVQAETFEFLSRICGFENIGIYGDFSGKLIEKFRRKQRIKRVIYVGRKVK